MASRPFGSQGSRRPGRRIRFRLHALKQRGDFASVIFTVLVEIKISQRRNTALSHLLSCLLTTLKSALKSALGYICRIASVCFAKETQAADDLFIPAIGENTQHRSAHAARCYSASRYARPPHSRMMPQPRSIRISVASGYKQHSA